MRLVHLDCFLKSSANRSSDQQILFLQKELTNKDNMIQCLLNQLSKQTNFIQKQHYELQREVLIDRNNIQYKNIHQSDTKETNIGQSVEQMAFTNDLILRAESVTETTQADHTANITQYTHDVVSTSIRRLYDVGDVV